MPLGQGIGDMFQAVRSRVEVGGTGSTWEVTAASFEDALDYARERFGEPAVLARKDRTRWWPRVTLTVTTDPALARSAPDLEEIAHATVPEQVSVGDVNAQEAGAPAVTEAAPRADAVEHDEPRPEDGAVPGRSRLPSSLEAIFAHQEERRMARENEYGDSNRR